MEQSININIHLTKKKPSFWTKLYCHLFGHTSQKTIIEDDQLITRYVCKHCNRRLGNGLRKTLPVPKGIDQTVWHNYMQELMESYKRYEGLGKGQRSRRRQH
jgi:RNase P subunit RPR2